MYPKLVLRIENHIPQIIFHPENGMSRNMIGVEENLLELITELGEKLNLNQEFKSKDEKLLQELLQLATEGDERFIADYPKLQQDSLSFELSNAINNHLEKSQSDFSDFSEYGELEEAVLEELKRNQNIDIFASLLEAIYLILIAKTLLICSELGIGQIELDDRNGYLRLQERMASELTKSGVEFKIIEIKK